MKMFSEEILTPGQKIKRFRNLLKVKQDEITGGKITRSLISYIENDKTKLVRDTAEIIANNINKIANEKNYNIEIDAQYLLEDEEEQAIQLICNIYNEIKEYCLTDSESMIKKEVEKLNDIKKYDIDNEIFIKIYKLVGDYYYNKMHYNDAYMHYLLELEHSFKTQDVKSIVSSIIDLSKCSIEKGDHQEAINLNLYGYSLLKSNNIESEKLVPRILFNNALAYKKKEEFDKCLATLEELELLDYELEISQRLDVLVLKGNCYLNKGQYSTAKNIYNELIDISNEQSLPEYVGMAYLNIGNIYMKINNLDLALKFTETSLEIRKIIKSSYLEKSLCLLGQIYTLKNDYKSAEKYYFKALDEIGEELVRKIEIIKELTIIYVKTFNNEMLEKITKVIITIIDNNKLCEKNRIDLKGILESMAYYYLNVDTNYSKHILEICLEL